MQARDGFETLRRIALLLLALAMLAERAVTRSPAVLCRVLAALRPAEAAARALAAGTVPLLVDDQTARNDPEDAARLAQSLRALALVFLALSHLHRLRARRARRRPERHSARNHAGQRPRPLAGHLARAPPAPHGPTFPASTQE